MLLHSNMTIHSTPDIPFTEIIFTMQNRLLPRLPRDICVNSIRYRDANIYYRHDIRISPKASKKYRNREATTSFNKLDTREQSTSLSVLSKSRKTSLTK